MQSPQALGTQELYIYKMQSPQVGVPEMAEPRVEAMRQACQSLSRCVMSLGNALHLRCTPGTDSDVTSIVQHLRRSACNVGRGHTSGKEETTATVCYEIVVRVNTQRHGRHQHRAYSTSW